MNLRIKPFADAVNDYPRLKDLFKKFCDQCEKSLNNNSHLKDVSFVCASDGRSGVLAAFGCNFTVAFEFTVLNQRPTGIVNVSLPERGKRDRVNLSRVFFDDLGNVRNNATDSAALDSLASVEYLNSFLGDLAKRYFAFLNDENKVVEPGTM